MLMKPKRIIVAMVLLLGVEMKMAFARQRNHSDEGGHVLALDNSWNRALETKDTKALDLLLADTFVSVDIDGSMETKRQFLAGIKAPDYHPSQAVTEHSTVEVYGDSAVVVGVFRTKGVDKGKTYVRRERFVDTWVKINGTWKCVAGNYGSDSFKAILRLGGVRFRRPDTCFSRPLNPRFPGTPG